MGCRGAIVRAHGLEVWVEEAKAFEPCLGELGGMPRVALLHFPDWQPFGSRVMA